MAKEIYNVHDMYVGMRSDVEFFQAKSQGLFDLSIWVDASERKPLEPRTSNQIESHMCDIIIDNNSTEEVLRNRVQRFCSVLRKDK